jgi:hypothetical protein
VASRKTNAKSPQEQLAKSTQLLGSGALRDARRQLIQAQANRAARHKASAKERKALDRQVALKRNAEIKAQLYQVQALGLYSPKLKPGERFKLTRGRKARIRQAYAQAEALAQGAVFAQYPTKSKPKRKAIQKQAKSVGALVTKKGIFLPRAERELRQPAGKLRYDKRLDIWVVDVKKTIKHKGGATTYTEHRPLAGFDALEKMRDRINSVFSTKKFNPKTQRLRFVIQGRNTSRQSFRDMQSLFDYARRYRKDDRSRATFIDSLTIVVVERRGDRWSNVVTEFGKRTPSEAIVKAVKRRPRKMKVGRGK